MASTSKLASTCSLCMRAHTTHGSGARRSTTGTWRVIASLDLAEEAAELRGAEARGALGGITEPGAFSSMLRARVEAELISPATGANEAPCKKNITKMAKRSVS